MQALKKHIFYRRNIKTGSLPFRIPARIINLKKDNDDVISMCQKCAYIEKRDLLYKTNYRSISMPPTASKIFESILFSQLQCFSNKFPSPLLCGFRKGCSAQYALINLQKWQRCLNVSDGIVRTLLMDLSKAYDFVNRNCKAIYEVDQNSLGLIQSYLSQTRQRVKVGSSLSE